MTNVKLYYVSQSDFDAKIKNGKFTPQAMLIYKALAAIGKPTRGADVVDYAIENFNLNTRQDSAVLAAWYFSVKRKPTCITLGVPTPVNEDPDAKVARLTAERDRIVAELEEAETAALAAAEAEEQEEESEESDSAA